MIHLGVVVWRAQFTGEGGLFNAFQAVSLGFAAALGERLGEVREQHRKPQPQADGAGKQRLAGQFPGGNRHGNQRGQQAADPDDKHDRVAPLGARTQFFKRIDQRLTNQRGFKQGQLLATHG
ncbi:hypothetical protein BN135_3641 [Cronobacter muytjensii 530]